MEKIEVGDFVIIHHPYSWGVAKEKGCLDPWEISNEGFIRGQVIGTYGPWDHVPGSKFHWDIVPDCWILAKDHPMNGEFDNYIGSCQIEVERVTKDVQRSRDWKLAILTNDLSTYIKSTDVKEYVIEKLIIEENIKRQQIRQVDTSGLNRYPVPV